jgi:PAS domain S-box-containing protein
VDHRDTSNIYQDFFLRNPVPMWIYDPDTLAFLEVNKAAEECYGYSRAEFLSMTIADLLAKDDLTVAGGTEPRDHEAMGHARGTPHVLKGGGTILVETSLHTVTHNGRRAEFVSAVDVTGFVDIGTGKARNEGRRHENAGPTLGTLQTILDGMDAAVYVADLESYEVLFANKKTREEFGGGVVGQICHKVFRDQDKPCSYCANPMLVDADGQPADPVVWEAQNPINNRWYLNYDRAVQWPDNRVVRVQIATDITNRKTSEARTQHLEMQLQQTRKMEALGTLAGGIAHDFNNILSAILGFTELALGDVPADTAVAEHLTDVLTAGNRAKELVHQILTFSRQAEPEVLPLDAHMIVSEAVSLLRSTLPATIAVALGPSPPRSTIMGDATQLHQVMVNLCTNAAHAMEDGGGSLKIGFANVRADSVHPDIGLQVADRDYLEITVRDSGHGIGPEVMEHIFDPFFTTKATGKGSGMGLAVVLGIVEAHHGHIHVESEENLGTVVRVYLPLIDQLAAVPETRDTRQSTNGSERVLLVDDEPQILGLIQRLLESAGYTVTGHRSGLEALEQFHADPQQFDLVLTDLTMPGMTGDTLAQEIRAVRREIPIILSTGFGLSLTDEAAEELGLSAVLLKPVGSAELLSTVRRTLDS